MFRPQNPLRTDFYNRTMERIKCNEIDDGYSIWQAIPRRRIDKTLEHHPFVGVMAGTRNILYNLVEETTRSSSGLNFSYLQDGMPFLMNDPVMQVIGNIDYCRILEPKIISTLFFMCGVATRTRSFVDLLGADRLIDFGMRSQVPGSWDYSTEAIILGGIKNTATEAALDIPYMKEGRDFNLVGTTGHSLYLEYMAAGYSQLATFRNIIQKFDQCFPDRLCGLLVDTVESFKGIDDALEIIYEQRQVNGKTHMIRLDSGDILKQVEYALIKSKQWGLDLELKIVISNGIDIERITSYEDMFRRKNIQADKHIIYGVGGALVSNISRESVASWAYKPSRFKLKNGTLIDTIKISDSKSKKSLPGLLGISYTSNEARIVRYNDKVINRIKNSKEHQAYMTKSAGQLRDEAAPYFDKIGHTYNKNPNDYLSKEVQAMIDGAEKRSVNFIV